MKKWIGFLVFCTMMVSMASERDRIYVFNMSESTSFRLNHCSGWTDNVLVEPGESASCLSGRVIVTSLYGIKKGFYDEVSCPAPKVFFIVVDDNHITGECGTESAMNLYYQQVIYPALYR